MEKSAVISFPVSCFMEIPRAKLTLKEWTAYANALAYMRENGGKLWDKDGEPLEDAELYSILGLGEDAAEDLLDKLYTVGFLCADAEGVSYNLPLCIEMMKEGAEKSGKVSKKGDKADSGKMPKGATEAVAMCNAKGARALFVSEIALPKAWASSWTMNGEKFKSFPDWAENFYNCHVSKRGKVSNG